MKKERILVVDDDQSVAKIVTRILQNAGYTVEAVNDGKDAVRVFRKKPFDLVITDILMPGQEGLSTIADLRRDYPAVKIIAISGSTNYGLQNYLSDAEAVGADIAMAKPFSPREMTATVQKLLCRKPSGTRR